MVTSFFAIFLWFRYVLQEFSNIKKYTFGDSPEVKQVKRVNENLLSVTRAVASVLPVASAISSA